MSKLIRNLTKNSENIMNSIFLGTFGIVSGGSLILDSVKYESKNQKTLQRATCFLSGTTLTGSLYYLIKHLKK